MSLSCVLVQQDDLRILEEAGDFRQSLPSKFVRVQIAATSICGSDVHYW